MDQLTPEIESSKEQKYRVSKRYSYDLFESLKELPVPGLTVEDFLKMCPPARQQLRQGVSNALPTKEVQTVTSIEQEDEGMKKPEEKRTSAYAQVHIDGTLAEAIIDTGAGSAVISNSFLQRKGWDIDEPTRITYTVANGQRDTTLGIVTKVPIQVQGLTIPIDMIVTNANSYDVILGNEWLVKANAIIDLNAAAMRITCHGKEINVPLDLYRGIRPPIRKQEEKEPVYYNELYTMTPWDENSDYQQSETPQWDTSSTGSWSTPTIHSWSDCGASDNIDFDNEKLPEWGDTSPVSQQDYPQYVRLPSEELFQENFRRGKCKHGTKFYHAEAQCISCILDGALLDQKAKETDQEASKDEPGDSGSEGPQFDLCAHGITIDGVTECIDCMRSKFHHDQEDTYAYHSEDFPEDPQQQDLGPCQDCYLSELGIIQGFQDITLWDRYRSLSEQIQKLVQERPPQEPSIQETPLSFLKDFQDFNDYTVALPEQQGFPGKEERLAALDQSIIKYNWSFRSYRRIRLGQHCPHDIRFVNHTDCCSRCNYLGLRIEIINADDEEKEFEKNKFKEIKDRYHRKQQSKQEKLAKLERKQRRPFCPFNESTRHFPTETCEDCRPWKKPCFATNRSRQRWRRICEAEQLSQELYHIQVEPTQYSRKLLVGVFRTQKDQKVLIPRLKHEGDAGYDLQTTSDEIIKAGSTTTIHTGLGFVIPEGYCGRIMSRSSLASAGLTVMGGLIDRV